MPSPLPLLPLRLIPAARAVASAVLLLCAARAFAAKAIQPAGLAGFSAGGDAPATAVALEDMPLGPAQFDTTTLPLPPNLPSLSLESEGLAEIGDYIRLSGAGHYIDSVRITLSSWATRSEYGGSSPYGFTHAVTLKLYRVDRTGGNPAIGAPLVVLTQNFLIPWRPEADAASTSPLRPWKAADGNYYAGYAFNLTFDVGALGVTLPDEIVYAISFNTQHHGPAPLGAPGPYDKLHVAFTQRTPEPGTDVERDAVFVRASGGAELRRDAGWTPFQPAVRFTNSAYGTITDAASTLRGLRSANAKIERALRDATQLVSFSLPRGLWDGYGRLRPEFGGTTFELLLEAVEELAAVSESGDASSVPAREVMFSLLGAAQSLSETALGDALIVGGRATRIAHAQDRIDESFASTERENYARALQQLWRAWDEAQAAVR